MFYPSYTTTSSIGVAAFEALANSIISHAQTAHAFAQDKYLKWAYPLSRYTGGWPTSSPMDFTPAYTHVGLQPILPSEFPPVFLFPVY
jgi:hypothetical protein